MKKIIKRAACVALSVLMIGGAFAGCSTQGNNNDGKKVYKVGVCQLVQHAALDKATEGFQAAIKEKLGDKVEVDVQNASGRYRRIPERSLPPSGNGTGYLRRVS